VIALEHFIDNKKNYALVIADLRMPGMNGLELLKKIRKFIPKVRTILISAYEVDNDPVFRGFVKEGVIDKFIHKPITIRGLCQEVSCQRDN
jgi:two-component system response regulator YesN